MKKNNPHAICIDERGHLILPSGISQEYGLIPGGEVHLEETEKGLIVSPSTTRLARVYIEVTNACNLECRTCMRNVWEEPIGFMSQQIFKGLLENIRSLQPLPLVFFGGYGEPLAHPNIREMVAAIRKIGAEVELITNGILLDETVSKWMIETGVQRLWVSIDGSTSQSYLDVRLGDALPQVLDNLERLKKLRLQYGLTNPQLGIAFVAMKRNIGDLPEVIRLGKLLGADQFSISNVLPHTPELRDQILYSKSLNNSNLQPSALLPTVSLPRIDLNEDFINQIAEILKGRSTIKLARQSLNLGVNICPFLEKGSISIRWDGAVSPCLALLHTHTSYLDENLRTTHASSFGNIKDHKLISIWNSKEYIQFRERLKTFDFSPCTFCNSCEMAESNTEDCFGNIQPACGGCLWAQGFIQCP